MAHSSEAYREKWQINYCQVILIFCLGVSSVLLGKTTSPKITLGLQFPPPVLCQNSPPRPICLGGPCRAWFIASLSYAGPVATIRL